MSITPLPTLDRTSASFRSECNAFFGNKMATFSVEMQAAIGALTAIAAGSAMAIPYTFSTTTTDSDPGAGFLRLSNATQNLSTTMRLDLTGADGSDWTSVIDTFDDSTSALKGHIMLQKLADASKWMLFAVTALASPSGYKNLTVSCVASSGASPFTNGDSLVLKFTAKGDKGDTGAAGGVGDHEVAVHTGNGHGSTNTKIRRFTTTLTNVGTAVTYADSAANGASFTINEAGLYAIYYSDYLPGAGGFGASVNSTQLTTDVAMITVANRLTYVPTTGSAPNPSVTRTVKLSAGDVVRPHTSGNLTGTDSFTYFAIRKVNT